ncbi:MAG: phosphonate ABC transporter ATP-binding protein [Inquilinaceae bacterium]
MIEVDGFRKTFGRAPPALKGVSLSIAEGEMVALIGASGSGKSTLLRGIAGLLSADRGSGGAVRLRGQTVQRDGKPGADIRVLRRDIGVIFQQFNLVGRLSLLTNAAIGALGRVPAWRGNLAWFTRGEKVTALDALRRVGMEPYARQRASTLSGGQQQRGAIARMLVQGARVILADEPIASLDPKAARRVMDVLSDLNRRDGLTVVVSLHQVEYALRCCPRTVALRDGAVVYDGPSRDLTPELLGSLYGADSEELHLPGWLGSGRDGATRSVDVDDTTAAELAPAELAPAALVAAANGAAKRRGAPVDAAG